MFDTISRANAKGAGLTLGAFRSVVNYKNTTNKGYVRFTRDDKGRITLGKVNNQIDVFVSLRQNVSADLNKEVRRQFVEALYRDLAYVNAADRQEIIKLAAGGKTFQNGTDNRVKLSDEALARTKLKEIFDKFDVQYNTPEGRTKIIKALLEEKAKALGISPNNYDECCQRLLGPNASFDDVIQKYTEKAGTGETEFGREKMAVDEESFRNFLWLLGQYGNARVKKDQLNQELTAMIAARLPGATGAAWGFELAQETKENLTSSLKDLLELDYDLTIPEWRADKTNPNLGSVNLLNVFVDKVLQYELRAVMDKAIALGLPKDASEEERTRAVSNLFNLDHVAELAKDFFRAATNAIDGEGAGGQKVEGGDKTGEGSDAIQKVAKEVKNTAENLANMRVAKNVRDATGNIAAMANIPMSEARKVSADLVNQAKDPFTQLTARVNMFVEDFITQRYPVKSAKERSFCVELQNVCLETTGKCLVVAQLQYGERSESDQKNPETGKNLYVARSKGIKDFVENTWKVFQQACSEGKENKGLTSRLFSHLMPNLVNAKVQALIENINDNSINRSVQMDEAAEKEAMQTLLAHKKLFDDQSGKIIEKFEATCAEFDKELKHLVKEGRITESERTTYLDQIEDACQEAVNDAVDVWLGGAPYTSLDGKEGADNLLRPIEEHLRKAASRMREKVMLAKSNRLPGIDIMLGYKLQMIKAALTAALDTVNDKMKKDLENYVTKAELEKTLLGADGPLEQAYNKLLFAQEGKIKIKTGEKFDWKSLKDGVQTELTAEAEKMIKAWYAYGQDLLKRVGETVTNALKGVIADPDEKEWHRYASLTGDARKKFISGLVSDTMIHAREAVVRAPLLRALQHPDLIKAKDMGISAKKDAKLLVLPSNAGNIWPSLDKVRTDRADTVKKWSEDKNRRDAIVTILVNELKGSYNAVWQDERRILIEKRAEIAFKEAAERGILEAAGGIDDFYARITDQIRTGLKPTLADEMKALESLFTAFSQKALEIEDQFNLSEDAEEKNLVLRAEARKRFVAMEKVPSIDEAAKLYQKMREDEAQNVIKEKKEDFERFEKIFGAIRNRVDSSKMWEDIWYVGEGMSKVAVTSKDSLEQGDYTQTFVKVYKPKIRTHFLNLVAQDVEKFCNMTEDEISSFVNDEMDRISNKLLDVRKFTHYAGPGAPTLARAPLEEDYIRAAGYGNELDNGQMKPRILRLVGALQNSERWLELLVKKTNAHVACAWAEYTGTAVSEQDRKDASCLVEYVKQCVGGYLTTTTNLEELQKKTEVANAYVTAEFDRWRNDPQLAAAKLVNDQTVIEYVRALFLEEVRKAATKAFDLNKPVSISDFSEDWFDEFFQSARISSNSHIVSSWINEATSKLMDAYKDQLKGTLAPLEAKDAGQDQRGFVAKAIAQNQAELKKYIQQVIADASMVFLGETDMNGPFYSQSDKGKFFELCLGCLDSKQVLRVNDICQSRFNVALNATGAVNEAMMRFEETYFKNYIFGKKKNALVWTLEGAKSSMAITSLLASTNRTLKPIERLFHAMREMLDAEVIRELSRTDGTFKLTAADKVMSDSFLSLLKDQYNALKALTKKKGASNLSSELKELSESYIDDESFMDLLQGVEDLLQGKDKATKEMTQEMKMVKHGATNDDDDVGENLFGNIDLDDDEL